MKRLKMAGSFVWMTMMMITILGLQLQVEVARAQNQTRPSNGTTPASEGARFSSQDLSFFIFHFSFLFHFYLFKFPLLFFVVLLCAWV